MFVDATFANGKDKKSIYGFILCLNGNVLTTSVKRNPSLGSTKHWETEFIEMIVGLKELLWAENIIKELKIKKSSIIFCNNLGAVKSARKTTNSGRTNMSMLSYNSLRTKSKKIN